MKTASQEWTVPADHPALEGHFPGRPIVPGVVWLQQVLETAEARLGFAPAGCRFSRVKFLGTAGPGETARLELTEKSGGFDFSIHGRAGPIARGQCRAGP